MRSVRFTSESALTDMWPFKRKPRTSDQPPTDALSFSQLGVTETLGSKFRPTENGWVHTSALDEMTPDPQAHGLPPRGASDEAVYAYFDQFSRLRDIFATETDGVYCPICQIANYSIAKLRTPCPKCNRPLLRFDWT
jgi:hypothetical protein